MKQEREALVKNAADEGQVKQAKQEEQSRASIDKFDLDFLLGTQQFKRFAWKILNETHVFATTWDGVSVENTLFREGERNVGIKLLSQITNTAPHRFVEMMQEFNKGEKNGKRNPNSDADSNDGK